MANINDKCKLFYLYKYVVANKSIKSCLNVYSVLLSSIKSINSK